MLYKLINSILHEFRLLWLFLRFDCSIFISCAAGFTCSAILIKQPDSVCEIVSYMFKLLIYSTLYIYFHCLANQYHGIDEDRLNKPHRPIVAGHITPQDTLKRYYIICFLYLLFSAYYIQLLPCSLIWAGCIYLYHFRRFDQHYGWKMLYLLFGTLGLTLNPWLIVTGIDLNFVMNFALAEFLAVIVGLMQDMRDTPGDAAIKRKTLPLVIGVHKLKKLLFCFLVLDALVMLLSALLLHYDILQCNARPELGFLYVLIQFGLVTNCIYRTLFMSSYQDEHITYCYFLVHCCCCFYFASVMSLNI